jgi:hypothetical protein
VRSPQTLDAICCHPAGNNNASPNAARAGGGDSITRAETLSGTCRGWRFCYAVWESSYVPIVRSATGLAEIHCRNCRNAAPR